MRLISLFLALLILPANTCLAEEKWRDRRSEHFIVYYTQKQDRSFAYKTSRKAERYYRTLGRIIGFVRYKNFWTMDNRAKIYIYPTRTDYVRATGMPEWSAGSVVYSDKTIRSYSGSNEFLNGILPHELSHIIFREFVGTKADAPAWLDEGVACFMEAERGKQHRRLGNRLYREKKYIPLKEYSRMNPMGIKDEKAVQVFYSQAVSLVGFLIENYGKARFSDFLKKLRDGKKFEGALDRTYYNRRIRDLAGLQEKWLEYVAK